MNKETHPVVYKNLIRNVPKDAITYYKMANQATAVMSEFFLSLYGAITPAFTRYTSYKTAKKAGKKKDKSNNTFSCFITLFFNWFTLEDIEGVNKHLCLQSQDVIPRYLSYLQEFNITIDSKWLEALQATVNSAIPDDPNKLDRTWVDRRLGFSFLNKKLNFSPESINSIFNNTRFPLQETAVDAHSYCRDLFSIIWGEGEKSDFETAGNKITALEAFVSSLPSDENLQSVCCKFLGLRTEMAAKDINSSFGMKGTPSTLAKFLAKKIDLDRDQLIRVIRGRNDVIEFRKNMPKDPAWLTLRDEICQTLNLPYDPEYFCEFASKAIERIKSNRKNALNTLIRRYDIDRTNPNIPEWLKEPIDKWCEDHKQPHLWDSDVGGLQQIKQAFNGSYTGTVLLLEKKSRNRRQTFAFLKMLANVLDQRPEVEMLDAVKDYKTYAENCFDFMRLRSPRLARFTNLPDHPQFGVSRPHASYKSTKDSAHIYRLDILTPTGKKTIEIVTYNKRASADLAHGNGKHVVSRRNKLLAMDCAMPMSELLPQLLSKKKSVPTIAANSGIKLVQDGDNYYIYVTYNLPIKKCLPLSAFAELSVGYKFLAFDPGIRKNITYAIGEIIRIPADVTKPYIKNDMVELPVGNQKAIRVLEPLVSNFSKTNSIREEDFKRQGNYSLCRLESKAARSVDDEAKLLFADLVKAELIYKDAICPEKMPAFISAAIAAIRRYAKQSENPDHQLLWRLNQILCNCSRNTGHLSYEKIINLKNLKSLYQLYQRKNPADWIEKSLNYAMDKIRNTREERFRRITNLICQKAIQNKVKAVIAENTCLDVHYKAPKAMMKKTDIWTPRRVLDQCKTQLNPLGIFFRTVISDYSSHTDFADYSMKPRYADLSADEIRKEIEYYEILRKPNRRKPDVPSTDEIYRNAIQDWLANHGCNWDNWQDNLVLKTERFPRKGGQWFPCSLTNDWIDSDVNAAIYFLRKGILSFASAKVPKSKLGEQPT